MMFMIYLVQLLYSPGIILNSLGSMWIKTSLCGQYFSSFLTFHLSGLNLSLSVKKIIQWSELNKLILAPISAGHPQNFKTEIFPTNHKKGIFSLTLTPAGNPLWNAVKYIFVCRSCVWMLSCMSEIRTNTYWNKCRVHLALSWRLKRDHWNRNISKFTKVLVKVQQHIQWGHFQVPAVSF